ncbi:MAG: 4-alpha-glucanotransferase [Gammaproteobacteria bacterium]
MDEDLRRLADQAGIEAGYWDALGTRRDLTEPTARALLVTLGFEADDPGAALRGLEEAQWRETLPPVVCLPADELPTLELVLDVLDEQTEVAWQLTLESGTVMHGTSRPQALAAHHRRVVDGRERGRYHLSLTPTTTLPPGYHHLTLPATGAACTLIAIPPRCHIPSDLEAGRRVFGVAVQLYSLRSAHNWGIGDFTDLAELATIAARGGAALIGVNPLHARHLVHSEDASPYAPSSRLMLDPLYIDIEACADLEHCASARALIDSTDFQDRLTRVRDTGLVEHSAVTALKLPILRQLFDTFRRRRDTGADAARAADFDAFVTDGGVPLGEFATFEALRLWRAASDGAASTWRSWPAAWRDPDSAEVMDFRVRHAVDIEFQRYLQWQADRQLGAAASAARDAGMAIGLYRDMAVGAADDSAETWANGSLIAAGASVGAPPDLLNREGQDWGLPPWNPRVLAARAYAPFAALLAANMRYAGALRIDHVMALTRLFWIPRGMNGDAGAYVRQAFDKLAGIAALESQRQACLVIGEDLGSVPEGLREALAARGFLSYRVLLFERHWDGDGSFKHPHEYPVQALATVATHDMPTIADYWSGNDIPRREALGLYPQPDLAAAETARREDERAGLLALFTELGLAPPEPTAAAVTHALHAVIARSEAMLAVVQLDDIAGEIEPVNIPGTHREYPNWQRKVNLPLEALEDDPRWQTLVAAMGAAGRT